MEKQEFTKDNKTVKMNFDENSKKIYVEISNGKHDNIIFYRGNSENRAQRMFNELKENIINNII